MLFGRHRGFLYGIVWGRELIKRAERQQREKGKDGKSSGRYSIDVLYGER